MRAVKRFFSQFHRYLLWLLLMVFFWAWIIMMLTDTVRAKKVTVYIDVPEVRSEELEAELLKEKPDGIKLIKVHPFSYAAFNTLVSGDADIYIMSKSVLEQNIELLCPIDPWTGTDAEKGCYYDGRLYGLLAWEPGGKGAAGNYIGYVGSENYYVCFNKESIHIFDLTGTGDSAALTAAKQLLGLP